MMEEFKNEQEFIKLADELAGSEYSAFTQPFVKEVIHRLRANAYHDFKNDVFAMPKSQMIADFTKIGRQDVVDRIKNGDFDQ